MNRNLAILMLLLFAISACSPTQPPGTAQPGLPNPASVFCEQNGGRLEIRTGADGGQAGACIFPDGSECDEWAFFRGECKAGDSLKPTEAPPPPPAAGGNLETNGLQIIAPQDGAVVNAPQVQVTGTASPNAVVTVNDDILIAGADGSFQTTVTLEEGLNLIEIVASDAAGNEASLNLTVTYEP